MSDKNIDEAKGRVKEAAGSLTDDDKLKREGKADQASPRSRTRSTTSPTRPRTRVDGNRD